MKITSRSKKMRKRERKRKRIKSWLKLHTRNGRKERLKKLDTRRKSISRRREDRRWKNKRSEWRGDRW